MEGIDAYHFVDLFIGLGVFITAVRWMRNNQPNRWIQFPAAMAGLLMIVFELAFMYRVIAWTTCPPMCGLQDWSLAIRIYLGFTILLTSLIVGVKSLWRVEWNGRHSHSQPSQEH